MSLVLFIDIEKGDSNRNIYILNNAVPLEPLRKIRDWKNRNGEKENKEGIKSREKKIRNTVAYLKACIYNSIHEVDSDIDGELRYQGLI